MLRRVARFLLLVFGLSSLALMGVTTFLFVEASSRWPSERVVMRAAGGTVVLTWYRNTSALPASLAPSTAPSTVSADLHAPHLPYLGLPDFYRSPDESTGLVLYAIFNHVDEPGFVTYAIFIPLWLLSLLCLAWPVTSFIIHRRRHKRGFPVEPKGGGGAVSTPVSSPARASDR